MKKYLERIWNGIVTENPTLILMLGMCPTLAVSTRAMNGVGMGLSTTAVLILSNLVISLLRRVIPNEVRLPAYIVVVASLVTVTELTMQAYLPELFAALGLYIPLIVVNCIILGRAEAYASKNPPLLSAFDGLGIGLGFTLALALAGALRELLGNGTVFGAQVLPESIEPIGIFVQPPGAFLIIALIIAVMNAIGIKTRQRKLVESPCDGRCGLCSQACEQKGGAKDE
ncbi:MAG: electron transport complex subunit E [Clostridia bacterium]|nr:electron transport complex subunit E [Clostridia bacterium]MBR5379338.1 electron transport complex subunit E [Clostridia bacterium]MBR5752323.1 electron transport complex subunit E [Clostridia bacterium]